MKDGFQASTFTDWNETLNYPDLQVFPNPAENTLSVRLLSANETFEKVLLRIFDSAGRMVYNRNIEEPANETTLDIDDLPAGHYLLNISTGFGVFNRQFSVVR